MRKLAGSAGEMWCACWVSAERRWQRGCPTGCMPRPAAARWCLGIDISDSITFDPAREAQYTAPLSLRAAYELLVTMSPGDYLEVKPALAKSWARTADGKGWRFVLADAKFNSGNPVTADDVKWTFDRLINIKDQPSQYRHQYGGRSM